MLFFLLGSSEYTESSVDKFSYMMNKYKFDIVALIETWLKNNETQLEYVRSDMVLEKLINRLRFSGSSFKVEIRTDYSL